MMKILQSALLSLFLMISFGFAKEGDKYLHISTNPNNVDVYQGEDRPNFASNPDYCSPDYVVVPQGEGNVLLTFFREEYADTTIDVKLSDKDTSYLIVSLRQSYDPDFIENQKKQLAHRSRRNLGHILLFTSAIPFAISATSALMTMHYIDEAEASKKRLENSLIHDGDNFIQAEKIFNEQKEDARSAKKAAGISLVTGLAILTVGIILSF